MSFSARTALQLDRQLVLGVENENSVTFRPIKPMGQHTDTSLYTSGVTVGWGKASTWKDSLVMVKTALSRLPETREALVSSRLGT